MPEISPYPVAVIGTGPAGLMAASVLSKAGLSVVIFEKRHSPAWKLLVAGSTGLNVTHDAPAATFHRYYSGPPGHFEKIFRDFAPAHWLDFLHALGIKTFAGSSRRHFVDGLKASPLLRAWLKDLRAHGVAIRYRHELADFITPSDSQTITLRFADGARFSCAAVCVCLGGGSREKSENPLRWPQFLLNKGIAFQPFRPANAGFDVAWPKGLLKEAEGSPLKNVVLKTRKGLQKGDLTLTRYGLEGAAVYALGEIGPARLDLKPDLTQAQILKRLQGARENLSPIRRAKKYLNLGPAVLALIFHLTPKDILNDAHALAMRIKDFPIEFTGQRPLDEAISSAGGLAFSELTDDLMLQRFPGVFAAGEMLDWDAPTGGFLIQACVSQGHAAGRGMLKYLGKLGARPHPLGSA